MTHRHLTLAIEPGKPHAGLPRPRRAWGRMRIAAATVAAVSLVASVALTYLIATGGTTQAPPPPAGFGTIPAADPAPPPRPGAVPETTTTSLPDTDEPAAAPQAEPARPPIPLTDGTYVPGETVAGPEPVSVQIGSLGIDAEVVPVGVDGTEMDIPRSAEQVAWYRYGPAPGEDGSAVLAAHVAWRKQPGAFNRLQEVSAGDVVTVGFDDGTTRTFEIVALTTYDKQGLPLDRIFARSGDPVLTLITCGGAFNPSLRSYEDNVVAFAVPYGSRPQPAAPDAE